MKKIEEVKTRIQTILEEPMGVKLYFLMKDGSVKLANIKDEESQEDNTAGQLLEGFREAVTEKMESLAGENILEISAADERVDALYIYDLEEKPVEVQVLLDIDDQEEQVFDFETDALKNIKAFIVVLGSSTENKMVLYREQYPFSLLKRDHFMMTPIPHKNRLVKVENDILKVDFNFHFFVLDQEVYILNINKLESICGFHDVIRREAKKGLESIKKMEILEDVEPLEDELDNVAFSRKLTKVCTHSKVVGKVSNKKIIKFTKRHKYFESHPIKLNVEGDKFILDTKKSKEAFLKLLNDDLLRSELTKGEYESVAKNSVE